MVAEHWFDSAVTAVTVRRLAVLLAGEVVETDDKDMKHDDNDDKAIAKDVGANNEVRLLVRGTDGQDSWEMALWDLEETDASDVISGEYADEARNVVKTVRKERDRIRA